MKLPISVFSLLAACSASTESSEFDPADYGYGSPSDTSDTSSTSSSSSIGTASITVEQGYCAVYEWKTDGDVVTLMPEVVLSSSRSFMGNPGSMLEVDCSNSYVAPQLEPIVSWSGCVINMVCDGATEDDVCDHNDVWFYAVPEDRADEYGVGCYEGSETGRG